MPNNKDERNAHPVDRQTKATDITSVCGLNALLEGEARAHRRVGYKNSVSRFHMLAMSKCNDLKNSLLDGTYRPERGEKHEVFEPKYRLTVSSKYVDRVAQASFVVKYFYPHVVPNLIDNNFACIKGRGVDLAREAFKDMLQQADIDDWCVCADMTNYFGSIQHDKLYDKVGKYITDDWAMWFYRVTVENSSFPIGLDLGSEVYQLSATAFPNQLDHSLDNGTYLRYQDDLRVVGTKSQCKEYMQAIRDGAKELWLTISEKKTYAQPIRRPIKFLGFSYLKHPSGKVTMKRLPDKLRKEKRKLKRMVAKGVPLERVQDHWRGARECIRKGSRSDLYKMDKFYGGLINDYYPQRPETDGNPAKETGCQCNQNGTDQGSTGLQHHDGTARRS